MPSLVPIPWQRHLYLTPSTLALLDKASDYYGDELYLYDADYRRISPAWRSYAQQKAAWQKYLNGGSPASNPDTGNRYHMRGAAFDLRLTTPRAQQACRRAGLIRDPAESWHWNDPDWRSMPIIKTRISPSGVITNLLTTRGDPFMPKVIVDQDAKQKYRYAVWDGGFIFDVITGTPEQIAARVARKKDIIGQKKAVPLSPAAFLAELADVNANRAQAGLTEIVRPT